MLLSNIILKTKASLVLITRQYLLLILYFCENCTILYFPIGLCSQENLFSASPKPTLNEQMNALRNKTGYWLMLINEFPKKLFCFANNNSWLFETYGLEYEHGHNTNNAN